MRYSLDQDLLTVAPFRPSFPPQPRVYSRDQRLLPSSAPRGVNISSILSTLRILPVATGLPTMVGVYESVWQLQVVAMNCVRRTISSQHVVVATRKN